MERNIKIEKLMDKMMVSYEEADDALRACGDDILDAALYLEALGKCRKTEGASFTESYTAPKMEAPKYEKRKSESFGEAMGRFFRWCGKVVKAGCDNNLVIAKGEEEFAKIPLIVMVLLLFPFFWLMIIILIVGMFNDFHYSVDGPAFRKNGRSNSALDKAFETCANVKNDFKKGYNKENNNTVFNDSNAYNDEHAFDEE